MIGTSNLGAGLNASGPAESGDQYMAAGIWQLTKRRGGHFNGSGLNELAIRI